MTEPAARPWSLANKARAEHRATRANRTASRANCSTCDSENNHHRHYRIPYCKLSVQCENENKTIDEKEINKRPKVRKKSSF